MDNPVQILVVSSEFTTCHALLDILKEEGWNAVCVSTVRKCVEVLTSQNIDLVFCDRRLANGTYRDVLAITHCLSRNIRLVVTSRLADWDEYLEALHDGAFDLITSPIQTADVVRVINQAQREGQWTCAPVAAGKASTASADGPV